MSMFKVDDVMISDGITPQGGNLIIAQAIINGAPAPKLFMDVRKDMIPDGQTAYFYGNKIIVTVHWSGFSEADLKACSGPIRISAGLNYQGSGVFMFVKFGDYQWGDVVTLPGLITSLNDMEKGFDKIVFVFVDSDNGQMVSARVLPIEGQFPDFFAYGNFMSYEYFEKSGRKRSGGYKSIRDLFDDWSSASMASRLWLLREDPEELSKAEGMVNADVDADNNIHWYQSK